MFISVKELIDELAQLPPDLEVMISTGSNKFSSLKALDACLLAKEDRGYEVIYEDDWEGEGVEEGEPFPGNNCVVLWP